MLLNIDFDKITYNCSFKNKLQGQARIAQLSTIHRFPVRILIGMQGCTKSSNVCIYYNHTKLIKSKTEETFPLTGLFGCQTIGIVYLATCSNCKKQYVGQTNRRFYDRMMEHITHNKWNQCIG